MELPNEVVVEFLLNLPVKDVLSYCQTSQRAGQICQDDYFWALLLQRHYPGVALNLRGRTHRQFYADIAPVEIWYNGVRIQDHPVDLTELPSFVSSLMNISNIATYQDADENAIGLQTSDGISFGFSPKGLDSTRRVMIYNIYYNEPEMGDVIKIVLRHYLGLANLYLTGGLPKEEITKMLRHPVLNRLLKK